MMSMNNESTKELEMDEPEIEALPQAGGVVSTTKENINDMLELADNIDRMIEAQNKIRTAVLKLAQPGDWVLFGEGNGGKAEIGFAGAMRIASTLGVNFTNWEARKETGRDDLGEWYRHEYECDATYRGRIIRAYGRASSRDKFFGKMKGEYRPLHEIDEGNIRIVARRSAMKEATKILFGLHHMDPEFLRKYGIKLDSAGGHSFKSTETKAAESLSLVTSISDARLEKSGKNTNGKAWNLYKISGAEGDIFWTFSSTEFENAKQAVINKQPANITYKVNDKGGKQVENIGLV